MLSANNVSTNLSCFLFFENAKTRQLYNNDDIMFFSYVLMFGQALV